MTKNKTTRPLGIIENRMAVMHTLSGNTQITAVVDFDSLLDKIRLRSALKVLIKEFEILSSRLVETELGFNFIASKINIDEIYSSVDLDRNYTLKQATEASLNTLLQVDKNLFRIELLRNLESKLSYILLSFHHSIVDSQAIITLINRLLRHYDEGEDYNFGTLQLIGKPLESYLSQHVSPMLASNKIAGNWAVNKPANLSERRTAYLESFFDLTGLVQLQRLSKRLSCSLNTLLTYAFCSAAASVRNRSNISCQSAVSLRHRTTPNIAMNKIGCYIGVLSLNIDASLQLQEFIASYENQLSYEVKRLVFSQSDDDFLLLRQTRDVMKKTEFFSHDVGMTNQGIVDLVVSYNEFKVLGYRSLVNRNGGNVAIVLHIVTLKEQGMSCAFTYSIPLLNPQTAEDIQAEFKRNIALMLSSEIEAINEKTF